MGEEERETCRMRCGGKNTRADQQSIHIRENITAKSQQLEMSLINVYERIGCPKAEVGKPPVDRIWPTAHFCKGGSIGTELHSFVYCCLCLFSCSTGGVKEFQQRDCPTVPKIFVI